MQQGENTPSPLRRTRVACKSCNAKRVKCDAGEGQPCWHCRMRKINCELIDSKRGKYSRVRRSGGAQRTPQPPQRTLNESNGQPNLHPVGSVTRSEEGRVAVPSPGVVQPSYSQGPRNSRGLFDSFNGESSNLHYVVELNHRSNGGSTEPLLTVHHPLPVSIAERPGSEAVNQPQAPISLQEALQMPTPDVLNQLVHTFFHRIHPAYPVFDRENFLQSYYANRASPLVLQTIALLGFTIGTDDLFRVAGFSDRATARKTHYLRAKALYDADYETDRMNLVAVLLLLGFWWAGPEDQKDTCFWVGCSSMLAQSLGMHRSMQNSPMSQRMKSLRKRIWWTIYARDRHVSAAFGRPYRIRDEDCDVEPLTEEDFTFDMGYTPGLIPAHEDYNAYYVIEMVNLAVIIGDILTAGYSPRSNLQTNFQATLQPEALERRLTEWETALPDQLRIKASDKYLGASFWACMAQFSYQNTVILLHPPKALESLSSDSTDRDLRARAAADSITRLAEDLLATGVINFGLIHLTPALFSALSVHTFVISRGESIQKQLAENKSRQCMLALSVIAKSWPVRIWISKAFVNLMKRLTGQGPVNVSSKITSSPRDQATSFDRLQTQNSASQAAVGPFPTGSDNLCTCNAGLQAGGIHADGCSWKAPGEFVHDSMWAEYLDNALDVDLLLYHCADPEQYMSFEGANWEAPDQSTAH